MSKIGKERREKEKERERRKTGKERREEEKEIRRKPATAWLWEDSFPAIL